MKPPLEFFASDDVPWTPVSDGVDERVLARDERDPDLLLTRIVRWRPGLDTTSAGPVQHAYFEEVIILRGSLHDLGLDRTFTRGHFASRPPGMLHGPWRTDEGCEMLEIRYDVNVAEETGAPGPGR